MKMRDILFLVIALASGYVGAYIQRLYQTPPLNPVIRATRFELIGPSGKPVAYWGSDPEKNIVLAFNDGSNHPVARFGLRDDGSTGSPFLDLVGKDGKFRARMQLGWRDRPILAMSDEKWEGRVMLGFVENDAPNPDDSDWALRFRFPDDASIGVMRDARTGSVSGKIFISDGKKAFLLFPR